MRRVVAGMLVLVACRSIPTTAPTTRPTPSARRVVPAAVPAARAVEEAELDARAWQRALESQLTAALSDPRSHRKAGFVSAKLGQLYYREYLRQPSAELFEVADRHLRRALALVADRQQPRLDLLRLLTTHAVLLDRSRLSEANLMAIMTLRGSEDPVVQAVAYNCVGVLASVGQDHVRATRAFERAAELEPDAPEILLNLAIRRLSFRDFASAREHGKKAVEIARARGSVALELEASLIVGIAASRLLRHDEARQAFDHAIELAPIDPRVRFDRARALEAAALADGDRGLDRRRVQEIVEAYRDFLDAVTAASSERRVEWREQIEFAKAHALDPLGLRRACSDAKQDECPRQELVESLWIDGRDLARHADAIAKERRDAGVVDPLPEREPDP